MWRLAIAAGVLTLGVSVCDAAGQSQPAPAGQVRAYQIAMGRYEGRMLISKGAAVPAFVIPTRQRFLWTWINGTGQVQRLAQDLFRVSGLDCVSHFCRQIYCSKIAWPVFACSDERQRDMSVPGRDTIVFGGETYMRVIPAP